jgi:hypothetical protein
VVRGVCALVRAWRRIAYTCCILLGPVAALSFAVELSMSRAVALRQSFATVSCPICERNVEAPFINIHLDSGCTKHGSGRRARDDDSNSELHVQGGNGGVDSRFDRVGSLKRRRLQPDSADNPALGSTSATATIASSTTPKVFPVFEGFGIARQQKTASILAAESEMSRCIKLDLLALPRARVYPLTQCAKSWVAHVPAWCSMSTDAFNTLWERHPKQQATVVLFGQEVTCSRWTKMYGQDYVFSGQRSASSGPLSSDSDGCGQELMAAFERICSLRPCQESAPGQPNGVLVNWYNKQMQLCCLSHWLTGGCVVALAFTGALKCLRLSPGMPMDLIILDHIPMTRLN